MRTEPGGFEPPIRESKSRALPLGHGPIEEHMWMAGIEPARHKASGSRPGESTKFHHIHKNILDARGGT